jgi:hypothetical protein
MNAHELIPEFILTEIRSRYEGHPIGSLLLAIDLYEGCRRTTDGIYWDIMQALAKSKHYTSEVWLDVAEQLLRGEK